MRTFVVIGQTAHDSFRLDDIPGTSGRIDVLLRCIRAALLSSHGIRRDTRVYLIFQKIGRVVRIDGGLARFIRPDERMLGSLLQKVFERESSDTFVEMRSGIAHARGGLDLVLAEVGGGFVLDEGATVDIRDADLGESPTFFVGDHLGFDEETRAKLGGLRVSIGPVSVHADDAVTIVTNEMDRRH